VEDIERGNRLREERKRLGLSQTDWGAAAGASKGSQILYEKGKAPTADYLAAIAAIGADVLYILTSKRSAGQETEAGVSHREAALLDNYRHCREEDRRAIDQIALTASTQQQGMTTPQRRRKGGE
jgi:transcriptional regulator with XRE-family HTH domain